MTRRNRERLMWLGGLVAVSLALALLESAYSVLNYRTPFFTGWLMLGLIVFLAGFNLRKKLAFLPLGSSATWLNLHIAAGLLTGVVFLLHVQFRIPNGIFESLLAVLYLGTLFSGVAGWWLSRVIPGRLTARGEEVLFERIPVFVKRVQEDVEKLVFDCVAETETTVVPELYMKHLKPFFERPRNALRHLVHSQQPREALLLEIRSQQRFLSAEERDVVEQISDRVCRKDDLDYHYALQGTLKLWLFVHIPLTYGLLVFAAFHAVAVHAYGGASS